MNAGPATAGHDGEVFACAFTPDGEFALSGGWDGHLRLWQAATGEPVAAIPASPKALSACAVSPDGSRWLSAELDGTLTFWDAATREPSKRVLAHTRPVSMIEFGDGGVPLVTASWDRGVKVWDAAGLEGVLLSGHLDIVAGCRLTPDGRQLLSWSHDGTLRLWDLDEMGQSAVLSGHEDRVTAGAVSPDGRWLASGGRDGVVHLWERDTQQIVSRVKRPVEVRGCFFLRDGSALLVADRDGAVTVHRVPDLESLSGAMTRQPVECAALDPAGRCLALGGVDGRVRFVAVEGFDEAPLFVTPTRAKFLRASPLQRLFGKSTVGHVYRLTCPACRRPFELGRAEPDQVIGCPGCRRRLRVGTLTRGELNEDAVRR
jgi:WD40 repeat protein